MSSRYLKVTNKYLFCLNCHSSTSYKTKRPMRCNTCARLFRRFNDRDRAIIQRCLSKPIPTHKQVAKDFEVSREYVRDLCNYVGATHNYRKSLNRYPAVYRGLSRVAIKFLKSVNAL